MVIVKFTRPFIYLWALPTTLVGAVFIPLALLTRGGIQLVDGVLEIYGGAVTWFLARPRVPPAPVRRFSIVLPPAAEIVGIPALSRDGRWMVYHSSDAAPLYIRSMDRGEVKPLPGTEGGRFPFFSPNGEWIGFNDTDGCGSPGSSGWAVQPESRGDWDHIPGFSSEFKRSRERARHNYCQ